MQWITAECVYTVSHTEIFTDVNQRTTNVPSVGTGPLIQKQSSTIYFSRRPGGECVLLTPDQFFFTFNTVCVFYSSRLTLSVCFSWRSSVPTAGCRIRRSFPRPVERRSPVLSLSFLERRSRALAKRSAARRRSPPRPSTWVPGVWCSPISVETSGMWWTSISHVRWASPAPSAMMPRPAGFTLEDHGKVEDSVLWESTIFRILKCNNSAYRYI